MASEFDIIENHFSFGVSPSVPLGVGDDAAVLSIKNANELVVATDTLLADVHFPSTMSAAHIASRSLLVNVSDFSAMGVRPQWYTLALTLPEVNEHWLAEFSRSLRIFSERLGIVLVGGDTTRGSLAITMTLMGSVNGTTLRRDAAKEGQQLWITGSLGRGAAGLKCLRESSFLADQPEARERLMQHFYAPGSLLDFATELVDVASAAIDISDGLVADGQHIAERSQLMLDIDWLCLPIDSDVLLGGNSDDLPHWVLTHGDDYQLLFTASANNDAAIAQLSSRFNVPCTRIGMTRGLKEGERAGINLLNNDALSAKLAGATGGFDHFSER